MTILLYHENGKSVPPNFTSFVFQCPIPLARRFQNLAHLTFPLISCRICRVYAVQGALGAPARRLLSCCGYSGMRNARKRPVAWQQPYSRRNS